MIAPDFDAVAKKMFAFAGKNRVVEILVGPSILMVADALRDAYEQGHDDGVEKENELWQSGKAR